MRCGRESALEAFGREIIRLSGEGEGASEAAAKVALTAPGAGIGTLGYMSPEQLRGHPLDERSDLFSLGAVFYEALAGRPVFPGETPADRIAAILSTDVDPLRVTGVAPETGVVLARPLALDPERRYPSGPPSSRT